MKREYTHECKILDLTYQKEDGLVVEVKCQVTVTSEGIIKTEELVEKLRRSKDFIPLEDLTEEIVIGWLQQRKHPFIGKMNLLVRRLEIEVDKEIKSPLSSGLPWK